MTPREILQHHRAVVMSENRALDAIWDGKPYQNSSLTLDVQQQMLQILDIDRATDRNATSGYLTARPTPALSLISRVLARLPYRHWEEEYRRFPSFLSEILFPIARVTSEEAPVAGSISTHGSTVSACTSVETYFADAAAQVATGIYYGQPTVRSYHDSDGRTLAFGKSTMFRTALLLRPIATSDIVVPAGTLVVVDDETVVKTRSRGHGAWCTEAQQVDSISVIPLRLGPVAYTKVEDKALFAVNNDSTRYDTARGDLVASQTLAYFQDIAAQILSEYRIEAA